MSKKAMTKTELIAAISEKTGSDRKSVSSTLDAIAEIVASEVADGGAVTLPGIGKIVCRERPERTVRNPATGEQLKKPADRAVKVTIAKPLKESVNA